MNSKLVQQAFLNYRALSLNETHSNFQEDCIFIRSTIYDKYDIALTLEECYIFWKHISYKWAVNWHFIDKENVSDNFFSFIRDYQVYDKRLNEAAEWSHQRSNELLVKPGDFEKLIKKSEELKKQYNIE